MKQNERTKEGGIVAGVNESNRLSLITSPSISTIEILKNGDKLSVKVGRKGNKSYVSSINFAIHQLL